VPVNADVREVDVLFVGQSDSMTPLGTKGVGELAITGMAAAIANAVYHATGTRVRSLPISIEKMLGHDSTNRPAHSPRAAFARTPEARATSKRGGLLSVNRATESARCVDVLPAMCSLQECGVCEDLCWALRDRSGGRPHGFHASPEEI
jgi:hypothetical protein